MKTKDSHAWVTSLKRVGLILFLFVSMAGWASAQNARQMVRKGNKLYEEGKYTEAEVQYKKALENDPDIFEGKFNSATSMLKQKKYEPAIEQFEILAGTTSDKENLAKVYHNLGNAYVANKNLQEAQQAYKLALKNNPKDEDTRYNLAYVNQALAQQQKQEQEQNKDEKPPEPSEYAKKVKAESDRLVANAQFREALHVMEEGLKKDKTVAAYNDYTERLKKVCGIEDK